MKFNFRKVVPIVTGALLLGSTIGFAANVAGQAASYPTSFANSVVVVGAAAAASDTNAANDLASDLGKLSAATGVAEASVSEGWLVRKAGTDFQYGYNFSNIDSRIDDGDLDLLADGNYDESKGNNDNDVDYEQTLDFVTGGNKLVFETNDEIDEEPTATYLKLTKNVKAYEYRLDFTDSPKYDNSSAANLKDDFELSRIKILGDEWVFIDASGSTGPTTLTLMGGAVQHTLMSGESVTLTVDGRAYDVTATVFDEEASFTINGETLTIDEGATARLQDAVKTNVGVAEILTSAKEATADQVTFYLGAVKLVLKDGDEVEVNGQDVDGSLVTVTLDTANSELDEIKVSYSPEDDTYIGLGQSWTDPVFGKFKFVLASLDQKTEEIQVTSGASTGSLKVKDTAGNMLDIPFTEDNSETGVFWGDDDKESTQTIKSGGVQGALGNMLVADGDSCMGSTSITDCEGILFLAVSSGGEARVIELRDIDLSNLEMDFRDLTTGKNVDNVDYANGTNNELDIGFININVSVTNVTGGSTGTMTNLTFNEMNFFGTNGFETSLDGEINLGAEGNKNITVTLKDDAANALGSFKMKLDSDLDISIDNLDVTMSDVEDGSDIQVGLDNRNWGAIFTWDSENKDDLTIVYPEEETIANAYVSPTTAAVTGRGVVPVVKDSELESSDKTGKNLVVVGGPAVNELAAELLKKDFPTYGPELGWEADTAYVQLFEGTEEAFASGQLALLVAGYEAKDTRSAATYLIANKKLDQKLSTAQATSVTAEAL